ncbi:acyl-CoA dehydrogenase family protein [Arenimonas daejeonensis]|uniref:acyl-CoA dehydrogenase family protein n=1 Tax=Arenimonas daejeonensis TaxID=370777 RepID=UPI00223EA03A|nr:acyl-CoA dehydrogenase family protein [Arenimonas daejeonensis]
MTEPRPATLFPFSDRSRELQARVAAFVADKVIPAEAEFAAHAADPATRWTIPAKLEALKAEARSAGLWNLFLPDAKLGAGLSNLDYAPIAEITGRSLHAPEVFNCSAPDTGNMEVLAHFATPEQQAPWLPKLLAGEIRSAFAMTEPDVASSDATNIALPIVREGDQYVINGRKWWTTGAGDPRCRILIVMGVTDPDAPVHRRQSMVLVPMDTPGVRVVRPLTVFGYDDAPHGHVEIEFDNVRVPVANRLRESGSGFEIAQARLGPGRIHHCMRLIGLAQRALEAMLERARSREAFGRPIGQHGMAQEAIALSRCEIEQARLLTLQAAAALDAFGLHGKKRVAPRRPAIRRESSRPATLLE